MVNGAHHYSADLPQGELKIPCFLKFVAKSENEAAKANGFLVDHLVVVIVESKELEMSVAV